MGKSELPNIDICFLELTESEKKELEELRKDPLVKIGQQLTQEDYKQKQELYKLRYYRKKALEANKKDLDPSLTN